MKKRFPVMITALVCTASLAIGVGASGVIKKITAELRPDFTVVVDGEKQTFKNAQGDVFHPCAIRYVLHQLKEEFEKETRSTIDLY